MKQIHLRLPFAVIFISLYFSILAQKTRYPFQVNVSGKGSKTLLFIPGFSCSGEVWKDVLPVYEKDYTCYTLSMAGFAGVPAQDTPSFRNWEKAIAAYIHEQKTGKPIIIGHSMGGGLALALAADYPQLLSGIVVVDALPCLAALMDPTFKPKEKAECSASVSQLVTMPDEQFLNLQKSGLPRLVADSSRIPIIAGWAAKSDRKTFTEMYCDFSNTDLRKKITGITCPALILLESYFVNLKPAMDEQYKNLKNAQLLYATKGLHFIMYDDKAWMEKQISEFLKVKRG